jgi:hypothetical protein
MLILGFDIHRPDNVFRHNRAKVSIAPTPHKATKVK